MSAVKMEMDEPPPRPGLLSLSDELLVDIFCLVPAPQEFSETCKRIYTISTDPWTRSRYFLQSGKLNAFYLILSKGRLLTPRCIDIMISSGAKVSRYLIQSIIGHYTKTNPIKHVKGRWCRSMRYSTFAHWVHLGAVRYGDTVDLNKGKDDASIIEHYISLKTRSSNDPDVTHEALEIRWLEVREVFEKYHFVPYDDKDPVMKEFSVWVSTEPRLLPLARRNGFGMLEDFREVVLRKIFFASMRTDPSNAYDEAEKLAKLVAEITELDPEVFLSRTLAAEICMDRLRRPHGYQALKILNRQGGLRLDLSILINDILKLYSNSFLLYCKEVVDILHTLYKDLPTAQASALRPLMILSIFSVNTPPLDATVPFAPTEGDIKRVEDGRTLALQTITNKLTDLGLLPVTKLDLMQVLESRITMSEKPVQRYIIQNQSELNITDLDVQNMFECAAIAALSVSRKGKMLKNLVERHPQRLWKSVRSAVLQYDVDPDDIVQELKQPTPSESPWSSLSLHPDSIFEDLSKRETQENSLGRIHANCGLLGDSTFLRRQLDRAVPYQPYSVVDWVLTHFGPRSREAAIFFAHAVVAGSKGCVDKFHDKQVPVTLKLFQLYFRRSENAPSRFWQAVETQPYYASELDYIPSERDGGSGGDDSEGRPAKRPRRQAAQAISSYRIAENSDVGPGTPGEPSDVDRNAERSEDGWEDEYSFTRTFSRGWGAAAIPPSPSVSKEDAIARADQIALWIKNLADIMHVEAAQLRARKKDVGRNERGKPIARTSKTPTHIQLLKKLPPLRRLEARLRGSAMGGDGVEAEPVEDAYEDHASDEDWVDPRKKRKKRTQV